MDNKLIQEWQKASDQLKALRASEMKLRKAVMAECFTDPKVGTNYTPLGNDWRIKLVYKMDKKMDEAALPPMLELLDAVNPTLRDTLIKWKPSLVESVYKNLNETEKKIVDNIITTRPASPALEIVPPKGTK